jgi:hypothetical protein
MRNHIKADDSGHAAQGMQCYIPIGWVRNPLWHCISASVVCAVSCVGRGLATCQFTSQSVIYNDSETRKRTTGLGSPWPTEPYKRRTSVLVVCCTGIWTRSRINSWLFCLTRSLLYRFWGFHNSPYSDCGPMYRDKKGCFLTSRP